MLSLLPIAPSAPPATRRSIADQLKYAIVWGTSAKHNRGQKVGLAHELQDEDGECTCAVRANVPRERSCLTDSTRFARVCSCATHQADLSRLSRGTYILQLIPPIDLWGEPLYLVLYRFCNIIFSSLLDQQQLAAPHITVEPCTVEGFLPGRNAVGGGRHAREKKSVRLQSFPSQKWPSQRGTR